MKAKIRNTEIYFDVAGSHMERVGDKLIEKPIVFLIHGGPGGNHLHFKADSIELAKHAQLVFIDQRGCGWSKKSHPSEYTLENNIEDIEALRQHLGIEKIILLGVSYGGMVAQGYALRYGKHVEKLILVCTAPSYHFIEMARKNLEKIGTKEQIEICERLLWSGNFASSKDIDDYSRITNSLYLYHHKTKKRVMPSTAHLSKPYQLKTRLSHDVLNAGFGGFLRKFNFIPKLKKIKCPTLILVGANDWICLPINSKTIAKQIPNSTLKIFPKCGHSITIDANKKYLAEVSKFIKR